MECTSCGKSLPTDAGVCSDCRTPPGGGATKDSRPLITDGGKDPSDDPLAPSGGEEHSEEDEGEQATESAGDEEVGDEAGGTPAEPPDDEGGDGEYLEPDDIVGDDFDDDSAEQPPADDPTEQPSGGQQPSEGQPGQESPEQPGQGQGPQGQPGQGQGPQGQPGQGQGPQGQPGQGQGPQGQPGQGQGPQGQPGQGPPPGQQPRQGSQPAGGAPGGQSGQQHPGQTETGAAIVDKIKEFPLVLGSMFGAAAALVPFLILSALTIVAGDQPVTIISDSNDEAILGGAPSDPQVQQAVVGDADIVTLQGLDVAAELLFSFLTFGSGERIRTIFVTAADTDLSAVDPVDYPNWERELDVLIGSGADGMLFSAPEAAFLILYAMTPYLLFVGARFLARHYSPTDSIVDHVVAGMTVTLGILPILLLVGLVFSTTALPQPILVGGLGLPLIIGSVGGLSVYGFDDISVLFSKFFGWGAILFGFLTAFVLAPTPEIGNISVTLSAPERVVMALGSYLEVLQVSPVDVFTLSLGRGIQGYVLWFAAFIITFGAGFTRAWLGRDELEEPLQGARAGASIFLGFVGTIALLLWVYPASLIFIDLSTDVRFFAEVYFESAVTGAGDYLTTILVAGVIVPMLLGGAGGAAALFMHQQMQNTPRQQQYSQQQPPQ